MKRTFTILIAMFCLMANANFSFAMREDGQDEIYLQGKIPPIGRSNRYDGSYFSGQTGSTYEIITPPVLRYNYAFLFSIKY